MSTTHWPHYSITLDAIDAAVRQQLENNAGSQDGRWHPDDVAAAVITCAEAVGAALSELMLTKQISFPR